jgi:hypothetical protein
MKSLQRGADPRLGEASETASSHEASGESGSSRSEICCWKTGLLRRHVPSSENAAARTDGLMWSSWVNTAVSPPMAAKSGSSEKKEQKKKTNTRECDHLYT